MAAAVLIGVLALVTLSEATGVTNLAATVIRIATGEGTLVIEVDDPTVEVSLDGEELSITGAGIQELKLRPGECQFHAIKDGQPVKQELVTISRGDRQVVRVTRESVVRGGDNGELLQAEAKAHVQLKQRDQAIEDYTQLIKLRPAHVMLWYERGHLYTRAGELKRAIADYTQMIRLNPELPPRAWAYWRRGAALAACSC